ncbi:MAG: peptide ABC transporter substrate-binding protein [Firmicutes bacterium]|nr:peptide ABC transporter substrate-binding protein [Bacillota bacterium]
MKSSKSIALAIALIAGTSMMVAPATMAAASARTATPRGTIAYALPPQTQLNWFSPIMNAADDTTYNSQFIDQIYKPLLWINNDYSINWKSSLARNITYNSAGTVYHVFLNPKWKWSNGQPVTTKDMMFAWNVIKATSAANAPTPWPFVGAGTGDIPSGVKSVVANSPYEMTFTLDKPANQQWFIYNGIIQITPIPAMAWDKYKNMTQEIKYLGDNASNPLFDKVVDGPFKVQSGTPSQSWVLVPNPDYSGHKSTVGKIVFDFEASDTAELSALKTGNLNVGYLDESQLGSERSLTSSGDTVTPTYPFAISWTEMNMWPGSPSKALFDQLYVRQALQLGYDNVGISKDIYKGYAVPIDGPIATVPHTSFIDPALVKSNPYPFDIARGRAMLEAHGWRMEHGVMTKGRQQLKFTMIFVSGTTSSTDAAEIMQQDWANEGIDVTLKPEPFSTFLTMTSTKTNYGWQLAVGSRWVYNGPGFYPTGGQLFATAAPSGTGFSNSEEDALIQATHTPYATLSETMHHFFAYEDYTARILPFLWGQNVSTLVVTAPDVHNVMPYLDAATGYSQMQYWTVSGS